MGIRLPACGCLLSGIALRGRRRVAGGMPWRCLSASLRRRCRSSRAPVAVIADPQEKVWLWLIEPNAAEDWNIWRLPGVRILGGNGVISVPPVGRTSGPGVHGRVAPFPGAALVDATDLEIVLRAAVQAAVLPPRRGKQCGGSPRTEKIGSSSARSSHH